MFACRHLQAVPACCLDLRNTAPEDHPHVQSLLQRACGHVSGLATMLRVGSDADSLQAAWALRALTAVPGNKWHEQARGAQRLSHAWGVFL